VAQPVGRNGKLDGHERLILPMEKFELATIVLAIGLQVVQNAGVDDAGKKIVKDDPLVVKSNDLLERWEIKILVIVYSSVVKAQE
jgi:hypothetical protein